MNKVIYRHEFKYQIDKITARKIEFEIKKFGMKADKHAQFKDGSYPVTSLYFDSYRLGDYEDKVGGFIKRKKIRARIYEPYLDNSKLVTMEIKHKHDTKNYKTRIRVNKDEFEDILKKGPASLLKAGHNRHDIQRDRVIWNFTRTSTKKKTLVVYLRKAFVNETNSLRITLDYDIKAKSQDDISKNNFLIPVNGDSVIMEVKYQYILPYWFRFIIVKHNLERIAFSKYTQSLEVLYKYNPLLK